MELDARLLVAASLTLGLSVWLLPWPVALGLGVAFLALGRLLASAGYVGHGGRGAVLVFGLFWAGMAFGLKLWDGWELQAAAWDSADLGLRLMVLMGLGLLLARLASPVRMGRAVAWCLRPVLGRERAGGIGLSLALMIHFIPMVWATWNTARRAMLLRRPCCGWFQRWVLLAQTLIRSLARATWTQALALGSRGLDSL